MIKRKKINKMIFYLMKATLILFLILSVRQDLIIYMKFFKKLIERYFNYNKTLFKILLLILTIDQELTLYIKILKNFDVNRDACVWSSIVPQRPGLQFAVCSRQRSYDMTNHWSQRLLDDYIINAQKKTGQSKYIEVYDSCLRDILASSRTRSCKTGKKFLQEYNKYLCILFRCQRCMVITKDVK